MKPLSEQLRERIEAERSIRGLTVSRMSVVLGINQSNLRRFLNGRGGITTKTVDRICERLQLKLERCE